MSKVSVSVVVIARNEEKNIKDCLKSLQGFGEVVLIDDYSSDKTCSIGREMGARVFKRHLNSNFSAQRNFGLKKTRNSWVLFVDADERVSKKLMHEIQKRVQESEYDGFLVPRRDVFLGKKMAYGETGSVVLLRLGKKNKGKWRRKVHEEWRIDGKIGRLKNSLVHKPENSVSGYLGKINYYSSIHSRSLMLERKKSSLLKIVFWPLGKFFVNYFMKLGIGDGAHGFVHATLMSLHSFLGWSKLWVIQREK